MRVYALLHLFAPRDDAYIGKMSECHTRLIFFIVLPITTCFEQYYGVNIRREGGEE